MRTAVAVITLTLKYNENYGIVDLTRWTLRYVNYISIKSTGKKEWKKQSTTWFELGHMGPEQEIEIIQENVSTLAGLTFSGSHFGNEVPSVTYDTSVLLAQRGWCAGAGHRARTGLLTGGRWGSGVRSPRCIQRGRRRFLVPRLW